MCKETDEPKEIDCEKELDKKLEEYCKLYELFEELKKLAGVEYE